MSGSGETIERIAEEWAASRVPHELIGSVCSCGEWSAQCGHNIPAQWADHLGSQANDR